jgi:two-component system, sensor histidine kinase and response regulator
MVGDKEKCLAAGMNDFIAKPIDVAQLFTTLARWVKPRHPAPAAPQPLQEVAQEAAQEAGQGAGQERPLPAIAGLKMEAALQRVGGNAVLMRKLLSRFVETQIDAMQRIGEAMDNNDLAAATRAAHTVKGLAGNIGAVALADAAARVEQMLAQGAAQGREEAIAAMGQELGELVARVSMALRSTAAPVQPAAPLAPAPADPAALAGEVRDMARLLAQDDAAAVKLLERVGPMLAAAGQGEPARQLRRLLAQYDFEGALDELREAATALQITL